MDQTIALAGREWSLPVLAVRQNRVVVPLLLELVPAMAEAYRTARSDGAAIDRLALLKALAPRYEAMCTVCFTALTRANPDFARAEFDELPIDTEDLIAAMVPIARAAGVLR